MQIEITSTVTEGTLAVFADQDLVCVANLSAYKPGSPIQLERTLSAGPHRLRVAYYKPDRSLLCEKEGLGDIFASGENKLAVRMGRGPRLLFRNELVLNVAWPGAQTSPADQHCAALMTPALTQ
jgi:hypothetical protein